MNEICHNTDGSFYCDCEIGYQEKGSEVRLSGRKSSSNFELRIPDQPAESSTVSGLVKLSELFCEDKNECLDENICDTDSILNNEICVNTVGSYFCNCAPGMGLMNRSQTALGYGLKMFPGKMTFSWVNESPLQVGIE